MSRFESELKQAVWPRSWRELTMRQGVSGYALKSSRWRQTSRGFYVPEMREAERTPTQRILEATPLVPGSGALGCWAAAFVRGVDQLDGVDPFTMRPLPVVLFRGADSGHIPRDWIKSKRDHLSAEEIEFVNGVPVTSELRTAFDGPRLAPDLPGAVAFVDACLHAWMIQRDVLTSYCSEHPGWAGVQQARLACELADPGARNPWESRFRVCYVVEARLPRPEVNKPVFDLDGNLLGIPDLLDEEAALVSEFDGQGHRQRAQHRADNAREEVFEGAGLTVVRGDSLDLAGHRPALARRLHAGYRRGLARNRSRDGWTTAEPLWWRRRTAPHELTDAEKNELFGRYST